MHGSFEPLALCGVIIAAGIIMHRSGVIAVGGAIGAGEIFYPIGEIGFGIALLRVDEITEFQGIANEEDRLERELRRCPNASCGRPNMLT